MDEPPHAGEAGSEEDGEEDGEEGSAEENGSSGDDEVDYEPEIVEDERKGVKVGRLVTRCDVRTFTEMPAAAARRHRQCWDVALLCGSISGLVSLL